MYICKYISKLRQIEIIECESKEDKEEDRKKLEEKTQIRYDDMNRFVEYYIRQELAKDSSEITNRNFEKIIKELKKKNQIFKEMMEE